MLFEWVSLKEYHERTVLYACLSLSSLSIISVKLGNGREWYGKVYVDTQDFDIL